MCRIAASSLEISQFSLSVNIRTCRTENRKLLGEEIVSPSGFFKDPLEYWSSVKVLTSLLTDDVSSVPSSQSGCWSILSSRLGRHTLCTFPADKHKRGRDGFLTFNRLIPQNICIQFDMSSSLCLLTIFLSSNITCGKIFSLLHNQKQFSQCFCSGIWQRLHECEEERCSRWSGRCSRWLCSAPVSSSRLESFPSACSRRRGSSSRRGPADRRRIRWNLKCTRVVYKGLVLEQVDRCSDPASPVDRLWTSPAGTALSWLPRWLLACWNGCRCISQNGTNCHCGSF